MIIGDNTTLTENQKRRVLRRVEKRGITCGSCGSDDFEVGEALTLGFLFLDEEHGMHMVALTCEVPNCEAPSTGIRLHQSEFLWEEETSDAE